MIDAVVADWTFGFTAALSEVKVWYWKGNIRSNIGLLWCGKNGVLHL